MPENQSETGLEIAVIGMEARVPGAATLAQFWRNLCDGVASLTSFSDQDLEARNVPAAIRNAPDFVPVGAPLEASDCFDAAFFGFSPNEAEILDPQHRLFLECAWNALENAGYAPNRYEGAIGVFAAAGMNGYLHNLYNNARVRNTVTPYEIFTSNDKDFLATRVSYKLNLRGPGITVQTACSSSLVAVHLAAQSLIAGECDMALAGGVSLSRQDGYRALEGSILSADGHCRAFDARANGTVTGNGLGIVVLKRLEDALADGDHIDAVIKGSAINNDGGAKASYTAPQVDSQAEVIATAQAAAAVHPDDISYIEAHGTGTNLGDPIEVAALTQAFRQGTDRAGFCALGSVKTNIGHLDTAAGVIGLIKTVLMLHHKQIPASLNFSAPNPRIDFENSPFVVNTTLRDWDTKNLRRAGVSSFGIGGTNAHVVLQEAPFAPTRISADLPVLFPLSAKSKGALETRMSDLANMLEDGAVSLSDVAHTLRVGREPFSHRHSIVARDTEQASAALRSLQHVAPNPSAATPAPVLLFPGQGSQSPGMMRDLYEHVPTFRDAFDTCCETLDPLLGGAFHTRVFAAGDEIHQTDIAQPALFAVEYALAQVWLGLGVKPHALHGHSLGEYVAATLAGVFDLQSALTLVVERGRLMQVAAPGAMIAVMHGDADICDALSDDLAIAARNAPGLTVLSGSLKAIAAAQTTLTARDIPYRQLRTSHAFHSPMMTQAAEAFETFVSKFHLNAPAIPMISNLTGTWLRDEDATDPAYWSRHIREPVQFAKGSATLQEIPGTVFIECGPGSTLSDLTTAQGPAIAVPGIGGRKDEMHDLMAAVGRAWSAGIDLDWGALTPGPNLRVALPGYPFERTVHWVEPDQDLPTNSFKSDDPADWIYTPTWQRQPLVGDVARERSGWLIYDEGQLGKALAAQLERSGADAYRVRLGMNFAEPEYRCFELSDTANMPDAPLFKTLADRGASPENIVFIWPLNEDLKQPARRLQSLIETLAANPRPLRLTVIMRGAVDVIGNEQLSPDQAILHGITMVAGQEYPWLGCRVIDLDPAETTKPADLVQDLHRMLITSRAPTTARRAGHCWTLDFTRPLSDRTAPTALQRTGVFVVIGHLERGFGRVWVDGLLQEPGARVAVIEDHTAVSLKPIDAVYHQNIDCADADALRGALDSVVAQHGRITGVFLSTALSNADVTAPLALLGNTQWDNAQNQNTAMLRSLAKAAQNMRLSFCCVQSSLSSIVGGVGLAAYAGAHHLADSFVIAQNRNTSTDWFTINWDALKDNEAPTFPGHAVLQENALSAAEAWDVTRRIISHGPSGQWVVSRSDLSARRNKWLNPEPRTGQEDNVETGRARPDIMTAFVAPRTEIEATVAQVLQDILGIDEIGVQDGFFELGGHSLMAIRATAKLREAFPVQVEMRELLYENPSAASIAQLIESKLPDAETLASMQSLLEEVETLSEDDLQTALSEAAAQ